jgi:hypothetical protein
MAIDGKQIGEDMHTIISNLETGKIVLMVRSLRYTDLQKLLNGGRPGLPRSRNLNPRLVSSVCQGR